MTSEGMGGCSLILGTGRDFSLRHHCVQTSCEVQAAPSSVENMRGRRSNSSLIEVERLERETKYLFPTSVSVSNAWSFTSTTHACLHKRARRQRNNILSIRASVDFSSCEQGSGPVPRREINLSVLKSVSTVSLLYCTIPVCSSGRSQLNAQ